MVVDDGNSDDDLSTAIEEVFGVSEIPVVPSAVSTTVEPTIAAPKQSDVLDKMADLKAQLDALMNAGGK